MRRKTVVRWVAGITMGLLVVMTGVSTLVYWARMPKVTTYSYSPAIGALLDGYSRWETLPWVPEKCAFPVVWEGEDGPEVLEDFVCVFTMRERAGEWTRHEYYVEQIEAPVLKYAQDMLLLENGHLSFFENLVSETNLPLLDGETVNWLNPTEIK